MKPILLTLFTLFSLHSLVTAADNQKLDLKPTFNRDKLENPSHMLLTTTKGPVTLNLWPGTAPGEIEVLPPEQDMTKPEDKLIAGRRIIKLGNVSTPQITVYKPAPAIDTGTSVIIAPGGGHHILAYDLEGTEVAEWLNTIGVTGIVLKYRVPGRNPEKRWKAAVQDAQRSVSLVRTKADELGIDPDKIGLMGFSAGAQTAGLTALFNDRQYAPIDAMDQASYKPDFVGIIYLGYPIHDEPGVIIGPDLPPFFMAVAHDDQDRSISSAELYIALKKAGVSGELHIFESGGHGYGLRRTEKPVTEWNLVMAKWMKQLGFLN